MLEPTFQVRDQGKTFAPMGKTVIQTLAKNGKLSDEAEVLDEVAGQWRDVGAFLFPAKVEDGNRRDAETQREEAVPVARRRELVKVQRSRGLYVALGLLLGVAGVHSLYAGFIGRGVAQLACAAGGGALVFAGGRLALLGVAVLVGLGVSLLVDLFRTVDADGDPLG